MGRQRLIMLYGFAGIGKTTLAKKLNRDIPFSLYIEADDILNMIGQWRLDEDKGRKYVYSLTKVMVEEYLRTGNDVVIPYLLLDSKQAVELEKIVKEAGAEFVELYIKSNKAESVEYLMERGTWGESDEIVITEKDRPHIEEIFDNMETAMKSRNRCWEIPYHRGDIERTYSGVKKILGMS